MALAVVRVVVSVFIGLGEGVVVSGRSSSGARLSTGLAGDGRVEPGAELANRPRRGYGYFQNEYRDEEGGRGGGGMISDTSTYALSAISSAMPESVRSYLGIGLGRHSFTSGFGSCVVFRRLCELGGN